MVAELDGQHLGVDGRTVHLAGGYQPDRLLVRAAHLHVAEEPAVIAHLE